MKKLKKRDTFLIAHARRMRQCRKRQQEQNLTAYRDRLNQQKKNYRLRIRAEILSDHPTSKTIDSVFKARTADKLRQRRCRLNQPNDKKVIQREKDRNYRRLKRIQERSTHLINNELNIIDASVQYNCTDDSIETAFF